MNNKTIIEDKTRALITTLCRRFDIRSLTVSKGLGITNSSEISDISIRFIKEQKDKELDYSVEFKLQRECTDIFQYLLSVNCDPELEVELTDRSERSDTALVNEKLCCFIETIRERVKSANKEQSVQNITYVGNTFILNNSTKFKVISDEGEGRLNIEVLTRDKPLDAKLTASGLLDGLYLGSIKLLET